MRVVAGLWFVAGLVAATPAMALELTGSFGAEGRYFVEPAAYPGQERHDVSAFAEVEMHHPFGDHGITLTPFYRVDAADPERTHFDLREGFVQLVSARAELAVGIRQVFWGVTESQHLVDIVGQTDAVENVDGEDRLGQPMVQLTVPTPNGTLDLFALPYFRERTFPGAEGRLRGPFLVSTDFTLYDHPDEERHLDGAARYDFYAGPLEVALSWFSGTSRDPILDPAVTCAALGCPAGVLMPRYVTIDQGGLETQLILGDWIWKLEAIRRFGFGFTDYSAATFGYEYTFPAVWGTYMDLGVLTEYMWDSRGSAATPFESDVMAGFRLAVNDLGSTELLAGLIGDPDGEWGLFAEGSRRYGEHLRAELEVRLFGGSAANTPTPLYYLRRDDHLQLSLAWYF
ncbi:MAG: hypothetical protein OEY97_07080 [Nitrospirota bacterium]|nr:hypothetical protein [Nitrospirota bacterium]